MEEAEIYGDSDVMGRVPAEFEQDPDGSSDIFSGVTASTITSCENTYTAQIDTQNIRLIKDTVYKVEDGLNRICNAIEQSVKAMEAIENAITTTFAKQAAILQLLVEKGGAGSMAIDERLLESIVRKAISDVIAREELMLRNSERVAQARGKRY
jgi:hypothetical protein